MKKLKSILKTFKRYLKEKNKQPREVEPIIIEEVDILTNKVKSVTAITQYEYY